MIPTRQINEVGELPKHMETSCGVVLVNFGTVLLLQYPQGHWDLPKGHVEKDEPFAETMKRELHEETGIEEIRIVDGFQKTTSYTYTYKGKERVKEVHWFLAETDEIDVTLSHEHRDYIWLDWESAFQLITHDETIEVVRAAKAFLQSI